MIKKIVVLVSFLVLIVSGGAVAQMRELTLSEKIENAKIIFEGKVIRKTCFWNVEHTLIFTSNTIEVYKIFKGDSTLSKIAVWTEGGQVGDEIQGSGSGLELKEGDIGVFMVELVNYPVETVLTKYLRVYGGPQGFIKYNLLEKTASDPYKKYNTIQEDVYKAITDKTGQSYRVIKSFSIDKPNEQKPDTECRWFKCCKKKHKKRIPDQNW